MTGQGGLVRSAMREAALAWGAVAAEPARFLRYGGAPMVAALGLQLALGILRPMPDMEGVAPDQQMAVISDWVAANTWPVFVWIVLTAWSTVRLMVQTTRWVVGGEDGVGLLDPGFGLRELRWLGWSFVLGVATLPAFLLMMVIVAMLSAVGAVAFGIGTGDMAAGGGTGAVVMAIIGTLIGYAAVTYTLARLMPGLVPIAFDRPAALGKAWTKGEPAAGYGTVLIYGVLVPPLLLSLLIGEQGMFSPIQTLLTLLGYVAYAALAVAVARHWYRAGEPGRDS
ncbi:MAG: hypothetical protein RLY86_2437 [Pseudomonadota bacterium]|jgi:hypothetical protein